MSVTPLQRKRVDGIIKYVRFFMDKRVEHAGRVNPDFLSTYSDLSWQQLETLREVLSEAKGYGPERIMVADILSSEDESKKRALFSPVDQNSILKEIIAAADSEHDKGRRTAGILNINDIQSFYQKLNASLIGLVEIIQTWIWWDLADAADLFCLDQQIHRLSVLASHEIDQKIVDHYRVVLNKPKGEITKNEIIVHEVQVLANIMSRLKSRLELEKAFQVIVARREQPDDQSAALFIAGSQHCKALSDLEGAKTLSDEQRNRYAQFLQCKPDQINLGLATQLERDRIADIKQQMSRILKSGSSLGEPFNFKQFYLKEVEKRYESVIAKFKQFLPNQAAPAVAAVKTEAQAR